MTEIQITVVTEGHGHEEDHSDPPRDEDTEPFEKEGLHEAVFGSSFADMFHSGRQKVIDKASGVKKSRGRDFTAFANLSDGAKGSYRTMLIDKLAQTYFGGDRGRSTSFVDDIIYPALKSGEIHSVHWGPQDVILKEYENSPAIARLPKDARNAAIADFKNRMLLVEPGALKMKGAVYHDMTPYMNKEPHVKEKKASTQTPLTDKDKAMDSRMMEASKAWAQHREDQRARDAARMERDAELEAENVTESGPEPVPEPESEPKPGPEHTPDSPPAPEPAPESKDYSSLKTGLKDRGLL